MLLTICELNAENLFISMEYYRGEPLDDMSEGDWKRLAIAQLRKKQKPIRKLWGLASAISDIEPDILMMIEVGGKESLEHFNRYFLDDHYVAHFIESNSKRVIDLAFLVKKDLRFTVEALSNRDLPVDVQAYHGSFKARFSRDVAELRLFKDAKLEMTVLLTHLKSKISTDKDFQGADMRKAEAQALAAFYNSLRSKHPLVPIVVGGDLNSELSNPELVAFSQTDLNDFHDVIGTPKEERVSLVHFDHKGVPHPQVLDYLLVSPHLKDKIVREKSCTYRYRSFYNIAHPLPTTFAERFQMPSDHFPLVLTLDMDR